MTDYILLFLAVILFTAQFAFTRLYEGRVKQTTAGALVLREFRNSWRGIIAAVTVAVAAVFVFVFLIIKAILLIKKP